MDTMPMAFRRISRCRVCRVRPQTHCTAGLCKQCVSRYNAPDLKALDRQLDYWYVPPTSRS